MERDSVGPPCVMVAVRTYFTIQVSKGVRLAFHQLGKEYQSDCIWQPNCL